VAVGRREEGAGRTGGDDEATAALKVKSTEVIATEAERSWNKRVSHSDPEKQGVHNGEIS